MNELLQQIEALINERTQNINGFFDKNINPFTKSIGWIINQFLNGQLLVEGDKLFVSVPIQELGIDPNIHQANYNQLQKVINDILGLHMIQSFVKINRPENIGGYGEGIYYVNENNYLGYVRNMEQRVSGDHPIYRAQRNDTLQYLTEIRFALRRHKDDAGRRIVERFVELYNPRIGGVQYANTQYKKVLIVGYTPWDVSLFPYKRIENIENGNIVYGYSRHALESPIVYINKGANLPFILNDYDIIVVFGDKCTRNNDIMNQLNNRKSGSKLIVIDTDNPNDKIFTPHNTFPFTLLDMARFYEYELPSLSPVIIDNPILSELFNELKQKVNESNKKPLTNLFRLSITNLYSLTEENKEKYLSKFIEELINLTSEQKDEIEKSNSEFLEKLNKISPKGEHLNAIHEGENSIVYWNFDDSEEKLTRFKKSINHGYSFKRDIRAIANNSNVNDNVYWFDTLFPNDKLVDYMLKYSILGQYKFLLYKGLDDNAFYSYLKHKAAEEKNAYQSELRKKLYDDFNFPLYFNGFENIKLEKDDEFTDNSFYSLDDLYSNTIVNNYDQKEYNVTFTDNSKTIISGYVAVKRQIMDCGTLLDLFEEEQEKDAENREEIYITYFETEDSFEKSVKYYLGETEYIFCNRYSMIWKELLKKIHLRYPDINKLYRMAKEQFGFIAKIDTLQRYTSLNAPDFPSPKNLKAILEFLESEQLIDKTGISNIIKAREINEKRKKAGRVLKLDLIQYHLDKELVNITEILKKFENPEQIYQQSKREGIIKTIQLKK